MIYDLSAEGGEPFSKSHVTTVDPCAQHHSLHSAATAEVMSDLHLYLQMEIILSQA